MIFHRLMNEADDGTSGEASGGAVGTGNDARVAMLNQIGDSVDEVRGEELAHVNDDDTTEPFREGEKAAKAEDTEQKQVSEEPAAPQLVKLKVNGQELELPIEEVIARAQKVEAADRYLAEAAEAKRAAEQAMRREEPAAPQEPEVDLVALARALQVGTEEEAVAALKTLTAQSKSLSGQDDIARQIDARLQFKTAMDKFTQDYSDIWNDPILRSVAQRMDAEMLEGNDTRPYSVRFTEIGDKLRTWKAGLGGAKPDDASQQGKEARKAAAPAVPEGAATKNQQQKQEDDEPDDATSIIRNMAQSRGGPQWMRA